MTWEEREIVNFLKGSPKVFYTAREIARRAAGKRVFAETPHWARPFLPKLVERGLLETDATGHFRIKGEDKKIDAKGRKWVSPAIARLLKKGKTDFSGVATLEISDEDVTLD